MCVCVCVCINSINAYETVFRALSALNSKSAQRRLPRYLMSSAHLSFQSTHESRVPCGYRRNLIGSDLISCPAATDTRIQYTVKCLSYILICACRYLLSGAHNVDLSSFFYQKPFKSHVVYNTRPQKMECSWLTWTVIALSIIVNCYNKKLIR